MGKKDKTISEIFGDIKTKINKASDYPDDSIKLILENSEEDLNKVKTSYNELVRFLILLIVLVITLTFALVMSYVYSKNLNQSYDELIKASNRSDSVNINLIKQYQAQDSIRLIEIDKKYKQQNILIDSLNDVSQKLDLAKRAYGLEFKEFRKNGKVYISVSSKNDSLN